MAKATKVALKVKGTEKKRSFVISQADAILGLKKSQWELSDDKYIVVDGYIVKKKKEVVKK